ncbi:MAG: hypothetical protein J6V74_01225, partial [Bacteroidales bacterium]|nr:hypothetical protein [Bacteroidales bacterium]
MKRFAFILFLVFPSFLSAQVENGRKYLNDLCSERMHGRGYVNNGIQNAEKYIKQKFESFQLQNLFDEGGSAVTYPVNTFPDKLQLTVDGVQLTAGTDYMIDAISGGGTATLKCIPFNKKDLQDICTGNNTSALKEKYKSKYAQNCLIFDETDTMLTAQQKEIINNWITLDLVWSDIYSIGAIIKITNQ